MKEQTACESRTPKRDMFNRKIRYLKSYLYLKIHGLFYSILFKIGLGWKFNAWLCRIGKYRKFTDGRCQYCGNKH